MAANEASGRPGREDGGGYEADPADAGGQDLDDVEDDMEHAPEDPEDSLWDEGLITLMIVGGVALLVFPEPATSATGMALITLGLLTWWFDAFG